MAVKNFSGVNSSLPIGFNRGNPQPLDSSTIWASLEEAKTYAASNPVAYVGQILSVNEGDAAKAYIIADEAGSLVEVGAAASGDDKSIVLDEGVLKLLGFDEAEAGAQLLKGADGKLSWVKPDTTTVEGLSATVEQHTKDIKTLGDKIGDKTVAEQIAEIVNENNNGSIDTLNEIAGWIVNDTTGAAKMANDISDITDKVGDSSVADQISAALKDGENEKYALASALEATDGNVSQNTNDIEAIYGLLGKSEGVDPKSVKDAIKDALQVNTAEEGQPAVYEDKYALKNHTHAIADVTGLPDALNNKAETSVTDDLANRLQAIENKANKDVIDAITQDKVDAWDAAEANVIEAIKVNGTTLIITDKAVDIPVLSADAFGVAKVDNTSIEANAGVIGVKAVHISKLYMNEDDELVLNGGQA